MILLILICVVAFVVLLWMLRRDGVSLGLPIAYLYSLLLLITCPAAFAHIAGRGYLLNSDLTELGMRFTAIGAICFVAGVWLSRSSAPTRLIPARCGSASLLVVLFNWRVDLCLRLYATL